MAKVVPMTSNCSLEVTSASLRRVLENYSATSLIRTNGSSSPQAQTLQKRRHLV